MEKVTFNLSGMSCGHCVARVGKALSNLDGVEVEYVGINTATVAFDASRISAASIGRGIEEAGYQVRSTSAHSDIPEGATTATRS